MHALFVFSTYYLFMCNTHRWLEACSVCLLPIDGTRLAFFVFNTDGMSCLCLVPIVVMRYTLCLVPNVGMSHAFFMFNTHCWHEACLVCV